MNQVVKWNDEKRAIIREMINDAKEISSLLKSGHGQRQESTVDTPEETD